MCELEPGCRQEVKLGFDELVEEINNKNPLCESVKEESLHFVVGAPNLGSKWQSIHGAHPRHLNEFSSQSPDISHFQYGKTSAIGFNPTVLPTHQITDEGDSWRNPREIYHSAEDPRFNTLTQSSTGLDKHNPQRQSGNEDHNCHRELKSSVLPHYSSYPMDSIHYRDNQESGGVSLIEPSLMSSKDPLLPGAWESTSLENVETVGCPIQIVEVPQGSSKSLASFCDKVRKIRESYSASDINSNSGKIWAITTVYPSQLFEGTKFRVNVSINAAPMLHLLPQANYLVKDLIAEILLLCANEQLFPNEYLLRVCGSEEFLQMDHCLGSHKIFQKSKSVFQLHLQKNRDAPGKFRRKSEDDHSLFLLNQLLEFTHIWKISRQCLSTVVKKYSFHVKQLLENQEDLEKKHLSSVFSSAPHPIQVFSQPVSSIYFWVLASNHPIPHSIQISEVSSISTCQNTHVNNIIEEVKNICRVLGCVETKQVSDAVKNLNLLQKGQPQNFHQKSETSKKGFMEKATAELSRAIYLLIEVYCSSFSTDFQPGHLPGGASSSHTGLHSHLSFTVCSLHNVPETWAHGYKAFSFSCWLTYAGKKLCQVKSCRSVPVTKSFFLLVNWNEIINFPLEIKSLPRESMLIIKVFGIDSATHSANLLAWTCLPLFPKEKSMMGSRLFSMTFQSEPPIEMIAPGIWDGSQPSPLTLQIDFPAAGWEYMKPDSEENRTDVEEPPRECLKHIARLSQKQTPLLLSGEKRRYLWFYRFYCDNENSSLPLVLGSAPGWDEGTVSEMHAILRRWTFSHPLEALGLLTSSFPDQDIREVAVQQLDRLLTGDVLECLPQLVQAVKFEWNLESPLVELLLRRSLQSIRVAHRLYWLLRDAQGEAFFQSWYQKLSAALQFCVGEALNDELSKEQKLVKLLGDIGEKVKSASDPQRRDVLKKEIGSLEEFFKDIKTCHLPLDPALCIKGIDRDACSYFTSNALPLKITFINADPMGENIGVIFKAGDDLRQDMLVLQIIQVMDNIWLQEGLNMQMIIYRCLSTGKAQGLIEMVPDAITLAKIHLHSGLIGPLKENTIKKWFSQHNHLKEDYEKALRNFFYSCAGWCVVTFILGVCDRHNDNIMLTKSGHMFHIDFGKFLGHAQTFGGIKRDRAPFIFTSEMEYFITEGGKNTQHFQDFVELCCRAYNIVRKHSQLILSLLEMILGSVDMKMLHAGLPELSGTEDLKYVYNNLRPQDTDLEATSHFTKKIKESLECFPVKLNNLIHTLAQMPAISLAKPTPQTLPQESYTLHKTRTIQRVTILGLSKTHSNLYLIEVTLSDKRKSLTQKSFEQFSRLHSQIQKQFPLLPLPEFPHWWHLPFTDSDHKRIRDLSHYVEQMLSGSYEVANSDCVLSFFLSEHMQPTLEDSQLVGPGEKYSDNNPKIQLLMTYEDSKLTILVKHMKNIHLPDGSAPSAHVEMYLLPHPSEVRKRKTKSVPKCTDPTYNEIVVYDEVLELQGHVLMLIVKSKTVFVGAINIQLCSVPLNEEKWYPLGNSII
ncbi:phosphatidylinositol 4-phosphate 3-kinase C2 domain-containing subunit gamma isoform X3 [Arvicola amphibius]|uniref:phosphatidylinositol 4-phosphate 3-kinase C2 domain-containing subunit gamma isoform X3 n=1 Tax=Arvicola amphibius TaxID=1047088 RepID=UPI0018E2E250|nr:phosphatidylinositol 4-phosphate 3-kinase C2 domain-containing subunit gamma isoform X3 [Arvicola amphibius]